ncbi:MAG: hypothetical protein CR986_04975 [Ignavibacteriae bacterium]|nr:MAG: hypothetical protein CR986_04975 [Ignavibacteriota bacterium]
MNKIFILFILFSTIIYSQEVVDIINLRENDSNGEPIKLGQTFTVAGIVTAANQFGKRGPSSIQDNTAGISIYGSFSSDVNIGDSVTITSTLAQYNGLTQLDYSSTSSKFILHKSNVSVEPKVVTISEILNQEWNGTETLEGSLVRVNNVQINSSGTFESSTNYDISDSTGSLELRIDNAVSSIIGASIPTSTVDIIGILGQYAPTVPRNSGYQILPRFLQDIVISNEPLILSPIIPADITPNSFTVYFSTSREGNSEVRYGLTSDLEFEPIVIDVLTKTHKVKVENLNESTTYYFKVLSTNDKGTSESEIFKVSTASSSTENGKINVYFNSSVDTSVAIPNNAAKGNVDFKQKVIERINSATYSLDIALYSFVGQDDIAKAIISSKKNRGVKVRVVYDSRQMQNSMQLLVDNGILISKRNLTEGIMHNKFMIVDARDTIKNNDWVWTGSWNWNYLNNRNNVIEINDYSLALAYTTEFEEMWGSDNDIPSSSAKFGSNKTDNTIHFFNIGGRGVELYFSPSDQTESKIVNAVNTADTSIFFGLLTFTSDPIYNSIYKSYQNGTTDIRGIINNVEDAGSEFLNLKNISEVFDYNSTKVFHHKYGLIDSYSASSDPIVITGSHNWTSSANRKNDENTLIIHDVYIANQYMQEFKARYNELGGTTDFQIPNITNVTEEREINNQFYLSQNYPNPFNPNTTINYTIPSTNKVKLKIYDVLGEEIETLVDELQNQGKYSVNFDASNLSSGIYYYQLITENFIKTKKMILLK